MASLRKALSYLCFGIAIVWSFFIALTGATAFLLNENWGHVIHRTWARVCLWLMGIKVSTVDLDNWPLSEAVVVAPNHESLFDILVLASLPRNFKWISKAEVNHLPGIGWCMRKMGCYFVKRDRTGQDLKVMQEVEEGLQHGKSVIIFPEGTRTRTGELLPFKKGAFRTAQNAGVPLCPIAIRGTRAIAPPGKVPEHRGHHTVVQVGKLFPTSKETSLPDLMESFRKELVELLAEN